MTHTEPTNGVVPAAIANRRLSVKELEQTLPSPEDVAAQAAQLRAASVSAISVNDVNLMMTAVLEKAKAGDPKCTRLILDHLNSHKPQPQREPPRQTPPAPAPIQLKPVEVEPPKPVAIAGPDADQQRLLVAMILLNHQPMSIAGLGKLARIEGEQIEALLNHEWFALQGGNARLTPAGRNQVG